MMEPQGQVLSNASITKAAVETDLEDVGFRGGVKRGHVCCFCCCDTRRAVLIVDVFQVLATISFIIFLLVGKAFVDYSASETNDEKVQADKEIIDSLPIFRVVVLFFFQFLLFGCGVVGAIQYRKQPIYCAIAGYLLGMVVALWYLHPAMIVVNLLSIYPHIVFVKEMDEHIMTPENYPNEVHSCCCVTASSQNASVNASVNELV